MDNVKLAQKELDDYHETCNGRDIKKCAKFYLKWFNKWKDVLKIDQEDFLENLNNFKNEEYGEFSPDDYL